ncbi:hypothetical protein [Nonomuraea salmonea]|uniref:Uncharacterized protein n=1 Tax=Nonomuraea salmonea TaxID=46181 RepID=A0ABV5NN10_9ACTN
MGRLTEGRDRINPAAGDHTELLKHFLDASRNGDRHRQSRQAVEHRPGERNMTALLGGLPESSRRPFL